MNKHNKKINKNEKGFTLLELMLYIAIATVILGAVSSMLLMLFSTRVKNDTITEVEQQGAQVLALITQSIKDSESVNTPVIGTTDTSLSLETSVAGTNPTIFDTSSNRIRITQGVDSPIFLTSDKVTVSNISFQNLSYTDTPDIVRIEFTLTHYNSEGRNEYNYSKNFYGSASIKIDP